MTPGQQQECYDKTDQERLAEAANDLKRIIKDLQRNADRLQYKIEEIRNRRVNDDAT